MQQMFCDVLQTKTLWPALGQGPLFDTQTLKWAEDRFLIGWSPWIGFNRGMVQEGHLILYTPSGQWLLKGPHKEAPGLMYDETQAEFFPSGCGVLVKAGEPVSIQFCSSNTGSAPGTNAATANARIYSVKA